MSSLARFAHLANDPDPAKARRLCREAWQEHGILCIRVADVREHGTRWQLEVLGNKMFGKRKDV